MNSSKKINFVVYRHPTSMLPSAVKVLNHFFFAAQKTMQTDKAPLLPQEPVPTYKNEPAPTQQSTATENYYANPVPPKDYEEYHTVQSKQSMNEAGMIFSLVNGCCGCLLAIIGVGLTIALIVEYNNATQHPLYRAIFGLTIALGVLFIVSGCFGFASAVVRPWVRVFKYEKIIF